MKLTPRIGDHHVIAFFDLDETVINTKSMFDFLQFYLEQKHKHTGRYIFRSRMKLFSYLAKRGVPRSFINRVYYLTYMGDSVCYFKETASRWFNERSERAGFFIEPVVRELRKHQQQGVEVCLVSGSARSIIEPIASYLNVSAILCSEQRIIANRFTGQVVEPMIGINKAKALSAYITESTAISAKDCFAYGDHITDVDMLESVGNPTAVAHPTQKETPLIVLARARGWNIIWLSE